MSNVDDQGRGLCTTSGDPVEEVRAGQTEPIGQHKAYIVLCEEERQKGFVRPYRDKYTHVGLAVCGVPLGEEAQAQTCHMDPGHEGVHGDVRGPAPYGCGTVTTMGRALSETYARDPGFYGSTFCVRCNKHLPVAEFVWTVDSQRVGS